MAASTPPAGPPVAPPPGAAPAPGPTTPRRPSAAGYWIGGATVVLGLVGAVVWGVVAWRSMTDTVEGFVRVPAPGEKVVQLEAGGYVIYDETAGATVEGRLFPYDITIRPEDGGPAPRIEGYGTDLSYSFSGHTGQALATVDIQEPGRYRVVVEGPPDPGAIALGESLGPALAATIAGTLGIGVAGVVVGAAVVVVTAVRRSRARRRELPPWARGGAPYGYVPASGYPPTARAPVPPDAPSAPWVEPRS